MLHDAVDSDVFIARMAGASQREGRDMRRNLLKVKRMKAISTPHHARHASLAHDVTQSAGDCGQLIPMTDAIEFNLGRKPEQLSADAGYCSEANLEALENRNIDAYVEPVG
jgi:hypothetical protein